MTVLIADCKHALRLYAQTPALSLLAVGVLTIAIAFVGSFVSLYVDLVLRPFPGIEDSNELVTIGQTGEARFSRIPVELIERLAAELSSVEAASGVDAIAMPVGGDRKNTPFEIVSSGFFEDIRPRIAFGRGFDASDHDPNAEPVVVISDRYWRERYGASSNVLGEIVEIGRFQPTDDGQMSEDFRIVGVMAPEMNGVMNDDVAFWVPFERILLSISFGNPIYEEVRATFPMRALARRRSGASTAAVTRELEDN